MAEAVNPPLESYAKHHTSVFGDMRASIKGTADMFLFGEPTNAMMKLLFKVYHENIIRLLSDSSDSSTPPPPSKKLKCMFGILQDNEDNLYVTISESPGYDFIGNTTTDPSYKEKKAMMILLLQSAGITVEYPEGSPPAPPTWVPHNKWRNANGTIINADEVRGRIVDPLLSNMLYTDGEGAGLDNQKDMYIPQIRSLSCEEDQREGGCVVQWVDSIEYLQRRKNNEPTFRPFKKYNLDSAGGTWKAECNNGHLCTESKLFAYAFLNNKSVKSFVAYWIGDRLPPENHIIPSYCYRTVGDSRIIQQERDKLEELKDRCDQVMDLPDAIRSDASYINTIRSTVQPIAVACPGCFANIQAYKTGTMVAWNQSNCYNPRRHSPAVGGGKKSRRRKTKRKINRRKSRKHK